MMPDRNKIKPRRSYTANSVPIAGTGDTQLDVNEIAINYADKILYVNQAGSIVSVPLGGGGGGGSLSGSVTIPASGDPQWQNTVLLLSGNGSLADSSSLNRTVTASGNAAATGAAKFGSASFTFDGDGDFLTVPSATSLDLGDSYTVECWINPASSSLGGGIIHRGMYSGPLESWSGLTLSLRGLGSALRVYFSGTTNANEQYVDVPQSNFPANTWTHLAVVRDGTTGWVYANGVAVGTKVSLNSTVPSNQPLHIGQWNLLVEGGSAAFYFQGLIDEVRLTKSVRYPGGTTFTPPTAAFPTGWYVAGGTYTTTTGSGGGGGGSGLSWSSVPASATATGAAGSIAYDDAGYFYVCTQENTWSRFASASFWTPNSVSGLQVWLDASSAGTLYDSTSGGSAVAVDGAIARWADKSGNGRHAIQSTSGSRPIRRVSGLNGKPSVQFVADTADSGDWLGIAHASALNGSSGLAIFAVYKTSDSGANRGIAGKWGPAGESWVFGYMDVASGLTTATHIANNGTSSVTRATTSNFNDGASRLLGYVNTSAGLQARMNGVLQGTNTSTVLGNASSTEGVVIGGYTNYGASTGQRLVSCSISELLIYSGSLTSQDVTDIESYLMTKWAIS